MIYVFNLIFGLNPFLMLLPTSIPQMNFEFSLSKELPYYLSDMV